jgi:hypothetical protein
MVWERGWREEGGSEGCEVGGVCGQKPTGAGSVDEHLQALMLGNEKFLSDVCIKARGAL